MKGPGTANQSISSPSRKATASTVSNSHHHLNLRITEHEAAPSITTAQLPPSLCWISRRIPCSTRLFSFLLWAASGHQVPLPLKRHTPKCGDPNYELICDANKTVLDFNSAKFYVQSISYVNETVNVVDVGLVGGGCVSFPSETILPSTDYADDSSFRYWEDVWASFVECREEIQSNKYYWPVPCLSGNKTFVYVVFGYQVSYLAPFCRFLTFVPSVYSGVMYTGTDQVFKLLQKGFLLTWKKGLNCGSPTQMVNYCFKEAWVIPSNIFPT